MRVLPGSLIFLWIGCHAAPAASSPKALVAVDAGLPERPARVTLHAKAGPAVFDVELALDEPSQERGLMFRKEVPPDTGMLFVFPGESPHVFWMKNTLVPLDMLFLSKLTPRDPRAPAKYVLEIAGGTSFARGFKVGDAVEFDGVP